MKKRQKYPAKILLFGEYLLIHGSRALAIPRDNIFGKWSYQTPKKQRDLQAFQAYISQLQATKKIDTIINTNLLDSDLKQGLWFDSNIPEGYGAGSSGAVVAAVYDQYVYDNKRTADYATLKILFSQLEGYFHGNSSGFDPLISYTNEALQLQQNGHIAPIPNQWDSSHPYQLFLIDTQQKRQTSPLVAKYLKDCESASFLHYVKTEIIPQSNACIDAYIDQKSKQLFQHIKVLSGHQLIAFKSMIPPVFLPLWEEGLYLSADFSIKLCGAGGGGYLLGIGTKKAIEDIGQRYRVYTLY